MMKLQESDGNLFRTMIERKDMMFTKRKKHRSLRRNGMFYIMILPFTVIFMIFTVIPAIGGLFASFTDFNGLTIPNFVGFDNYIRLFLKDTVFFTVFKNTLLQAVMVGPIGFLLSFIIAWLINELPKAIRLVIIFLVYSPSFSGTLYTVWQYVFSNDANGVMNSLLQKFGLEPVSWLSDPTYSMSVVIFVSIWMSFGAGFLSFVAGFRGLDRAYYEAAAIDGLHNRWQELYYVTLPQMRPQLLFGAVQSISAGFAVGSINQALAGYPSTDNATDTIILYMSDLGKTRFEYGYAAAMSVILMLIMQASWRLVNKALRTIYSE